MTVISRGASMKDVVAQALAERVRHGDVIGVGTGSTVDAALVAIGRRVAAEKLSLKVVPTSIQSAWRCQAIGLDVLYPGYRGELAWGFDGADEVNSDLWLIKGKGGALLQEKILAARCREFIVIVDESKLVASLVERCAVPLEVIPEAIAVVERKLAELQPREVTIREGSGKKGPVITEAGNIIVDVLLTRIDRSVEQRLKSIVGVVETGLFIDYATEVIVGSASGCRTIKKSS